MIAGELLILVVVVVNYWLAPISRASLHEKKYGSHDRAAASTSELLKPPVVVN